MPNDRKEYISVATRLRKLGEHFQKKGFDKFDKKSIEADETLSKSDKSLLQFYQIAQTKPPRKEDLKEIAGKIGELMSTARFKVSGGKFSSKK